MLKTLAMAVAFVLLTPAVHAQSAESVQKELKQHGEKLKPWTADPILLEAVRVQNAKAVPLADVQKLDEAWSAGRNEALVQKTITGPCSDRLRVLAARHGYGEVFLSDNQGALVCASARTSDYWQGDEAKWIKAFDGGKGATFIDRPRMDDSAKAHLAQISVAVMQGDHAIGVLTAGVAK